MSAGISAICLLEILGEDEKRIDLGEEPVILAADTLSPAELDGDG